MDNPKNFENVPSISKAIDLSINYDKKNIIKIDPIIKAKRKIKKEFSSMKIFAEKVINEEPIKKGKCVDEKSLAQKRDSAGYDSDIELQEREDALKALKHSKLNDLLLEDTEEVQEFNRTARFCQIQAARDKQLQEAYRLELLKESMDRYSKNDLSESGEYFTEAKKKKMAQNEYQKQFLAATTYQINASNFEKEINFLEKQHFSENENLKNLKYAMIEIKKRNEKLNRNHEFLSTLQKIIKYDEDLKKWDTEEAILRYDRELNFLKEKEKFNEAFNNKKNLKEKALNENRMKANEVLTNLRKSKEEKDSMREELSFYMKNKEMDQLMALKKLEIQRKNIEGARIRDRLMKYNENMNKLQKINDGIDYKKILNDFNDDEMRKDAERRQLKIAKDKVRVVILQQLNDKERNDTEGLKNKFQEGNRLALAEMSRMKNIKALLPLKVEELRKNHLPEPYLAPLKKFYLND